MPLSKKLSKIGNSWGAILSSEVMKISGIHPEEHYEIETLPHEIRLKFNSRTGDDVKDRRVANAVSRFVKKYREDLKKLAT